MVLRIPTNVTRLSILDPTPERTGLLRRYLDLCELEQRLVQQARKTGCQCQACKRLRGEIE